LHPPKMRAIFPKHSTPIPTDQQQYPRCNCSAKVVSNMTTSTHKKWLWSLLAVAAVGLALSGLLDRIGAAYADQSFTRALVTFAGARALNGAISVAQGTELAVEPGGVGVIIAIGEVLDPVNDLIEQFSTVMLIATSSLGLQKVLLDITAWWGISAILIIVALTVIASSFISFAKLPQLELLAKRLMLIMIFVRFVLPLLTIGTTFVFDTFLAAEQAAATAALESTTEAVQEINQDGAQSQSDALADDPSFLDRLDSAFDDAMQSLDLRNRLDRAQLALSDASEHVINLIVIFILQTVLLPIVFAWLLFELLKTLAVRAVGK
jgi:hypothetical protein